MLGADRRDRQTRGTRARDVEDRERPRPRLRAAHGKGEAKPRHGRIELVCRDAQVQVDVALRERSGHARRAGEHELTGHAQRDERLARPRSGPPAPRRAGRQTAPDRARPQPTIADPRGRGSSGQDSRTCTCTNGGFTTVASTPRPRTSIDTVVAVGDAGSQQRQGDALLEGRREGARGDLADRLAVVG